MRARFGLASIGLALLLGAATASQAQSNPKVQDMKRAPKEFLNEVVRVEGFVTQYVEGDAQTTRFFFIKDDWGGFLKVRTSREAPEVGHRYSVTGPIGIDPRTNEIYMSEEQRSNVDTAPGSDAGGPVEPPIASPGAGQAGDASGSSGGAMNLGLIVVLGVVLLGLVVGLVVVLSGRKRERPRTDDFAAAASIPAEAAPPPQQVIEGKTIKLHAPPPGTLKLLPGWLEVVSGEDTVKEIRFYRLKGEAVAETTFGRAAGRPYTHIQLKPMTVSSRQAAIVFDGAAPKLTNFASNESNPTRVNGRELAVDEGVILSDGDKIEMGEIGFVFHAA